MQTQYFSPALQGLLGVVSVIIVAAAIIQLKFLVNPLLLAILFFVLSMPFLDWLKRLGVPSILSVFITMVGMILILSVMVNLLAVSLEDFVQDLPFLFYQFQVRVQSITPIFPSFNLGDLQINERVAQFFDTGQIVNVLTSSLQGLVSAFGNLMLVVMLLLFMLLEANHLAMKVDNLPEKTNHSITKLSANIKRYLAIKGFFGLLTGVLIGVFLWIYGIEYPFLMGTIAFILNFIPAIGSIIAAIPALMLVLVNHELVDFVVVLVWYCLVNISIGNFFEPRFLGQQMGISPLVVLLSLMLWGWMLGPVGMFMAVPLSMSIKIALANSPKTKWLAMLMS